MPVLRPDGHTYGGKSPLAPLHLTVNDILIYILHFCLQLDPFQVAIWLKDCIADRVQAIALTKWYIQ